MSAPFAIRPATPGDIQALARIHVEGWRASYTGIVDPQFLASLDEADCRARWQDWFSHENFHALIAHDESGAPAGFVSFGKLKTPPPGSSPIRPPYSAEIYALYLLPAYFRKGLGTMLLREAARALAGLRHKSLCLWVLEKNTRGVAFYTARGGQRIGKKEVEIGATKAREICFGWRDTGIIFQNAQPSLKSP